MNRERAKELLPIFQAYAEGKDIEYKPKADNEWKEADFPGFYNDIDYRIKPEEPYTVPRHIEGFRALRDGEEWFKVCSFQKEDLPKGYRPVLLGENVDEDVEYLYDGKWKQRGIHGEDVIGVIHKPHRTTRPLPPVKIKKKVPLEAKDILPGSVIRQTRWHPACFDIITQVTRIQVTAGNKEITYHQMMDDFLIHHPSYGYGNGLPIWKPCCKEIELEES